MSTKKSLEDEYEGQFGSGFIKSSDDLQITVLEDDRGVTVDLQNPVSQKKYYKGNVERNGPLFTKGNLYQLVVDGNTKVPRKLKYTARWTENGNYKTRLSFEK